MDAQIKRKARRRRRELVMTLVVCLGLTGGGYGWFIQSPSRVQAFSDAMKDIRSVGDVKGLVAAVGRTMPIVSARAWTPSGTVWDSDTSNKSWNYLGSPAAFAAGDDVQFAGRGLVNGSATVPVAAQGVDPRAITFANNSGTYTFTGGAIRNTGTLLKSRGGAVVF